MGKIQIKQLTQNVFQHISFLHTESFGKVACNGLVIKNGQEALVFDSPVDHEDAKTLIEWVKKELKCKIVAVVATHFHDDCIGGLGAFHDQDIVSYANELTIALVDTTKYSAPKKSFKESMDFNLEREEVQIRFVGEGHTVDNVVGYFTKEHVLFGGCLIKALNAPKGYLGDANVEAWPKTVEKVKMAFPKVELVVPGHGDAGGTELLDYTITLFSEN